MLIIENSLHPRLSVRVWLKSPPTIKRRVPSDITKRGQCDSRQPNRFCFRSHRLDQPTPNPLAHPCHRDTQFTKVQGTRSIPRQRKPDDVAFRHRYPQSLSRLRLFHARFRQPRQIVGQPRGRIQPTRFIFDAANTLGLGHGRQLNVNFRSPVVAHRWPSFARLGDIRTRGRRSDPRQRHSCQSMNGSRTDPKSTSFRLRMQSTRVVSQAISAIGSQLSP